MMLRFFIFTMSLLPSGCFGGGTAVPEDHFYRLAELPAPEKLSSPLVDVLAISTLQSDALLRERAILYSEAQTPLTIRRYHYHFWTHVPGQLIQEQMLDQLRAAGVARSVIRYGEQPRVDAVVEGYLKRFERLVGNGRPRAALALELVYRKRAQDSEPLIRTYEVVETATNDSMHATVTAFSAALHKVYAAFTAELAATR